MAFDELSIPQVQRRIHPLGFFFRLPIATGKKLCYNGYQQIPGVGLMAEIRIVAADYARIMREQVEPFLAGVRQEGFFEAKDGLRIHYEMMLHPESRGAIVVSHGYTESAEKFRELAYRCYVRGFSVFAIDHRGHGQSGRLVSPEFLTHVDNFADYVEDFERFVDQVVEPHNGGRPKVLFGHSMGGAIAALALIRRPKAYDRAVLNAPMIAINTGRIPVWACRALSGALCALGRGRKRMPTFAKAYNPNEDFATSCSANRERFDYYQQKRRSMQHLQNTSPTASWVKTSLDVADVLLDSANAGEISCPVLLLQAERDDTVDNGAQQRFIDLVSQGRLVQIPGSKHEIFMSGDASLEAYYKELFDFLEGCE